jgi:hypothetical protein
MDEMQLHDALKASLNTMVSDHPTDGHTQAIIGDITAHIDLNPHMDGISMVLGQVATDVLNERDPRRIALFVRESLTIVAIAAGYKLGHQAATSMFYETSQGLAELPTIQEEGDHNGSTD